MNQYKNELLKRIALQHWAATNLKIERAIESISEARYSAELAPGRSTPAWIFCHLLQVNDNMFPILGFGANLYPELHDVMNSKEIAPHTAFELDELRQMWIHIGSKLLEHFNGMTGDQWLEKHSNISEDDFKKEPHRNKVNVVLHRLIHMSHHAGQLALIK